MALDAENYSCSADGGETGSRASTGKRMDLSFCTSVWSRAHTSGQEVKLKYEP